jgi:hypothetical protein
VTDIKGTKIVFEWGREDDAPSLGEPPEVVPVDDFEQQEYVCQSYEVTPAAVRMRNAQLDGGWIWEEVGIPLAGLRRWFVGAGVSDAERLPGGEWAQ